MFVRLINLKKLMIIWPASKVWAADGGTSLVLWVWLNLELNRGTPYDIYEMVTSY
jgi:hypothetical protein